MTTVLEEVKRIHDSIEQKSSSKKDEIAVMQAMLNDRTYKVDVYSRQGVKEQYCPAEDFRSMMSNCVSSMCKIKQSEADTLVENYEFKKNDAETVINVGKEFINTYLPTGRKIKLGGREKSDVSIEQKICPAGMRPYPAIAGTDDNGNPIRVRKETWVDEYAGIKASSPCPFWIKNKG